MKMRSAGVSSVVGPGGRSPAGTTEVEPTRRAGSDGVERRADAADAEAPARTLPVPAGTIARGACAVRHGFRRLADAAVAADRDDQRRVPGGDHVASVARIVASEPASITGARPVRLRTAAETADTTRSRRAGSIIPEALGLTRTSGSPEAIGVGVTGRCYALP